MKFIIFEQLACLAHLPQNSQPSQLWITSFIVIINLQCLGLMLPNDGWGLWEYLDGHFSLLKQIAQMSLLLPYFLNNQQYYSSLAFSVAIIVLISFISIILVFLFFGVQKNSNPANYSKTRKFIYNFIMIITTILQIPTLLLCISLILIHDTGLNQQLSVFNAKSILSLFTLLLFSILIGNQIYFLRANTFVPLFIIQSRFNSLQIFEYLVSLFNSVFYFIKNDTTTISFVKISMIFLQVILKLTQSKVLRSRTPQMNQTQFSLNISLFVILILISINIFTGNQYIFQENQLIFSIMVLGCFAYYVGYQYFERQCLCPFQYHMNCQSCISYTQEMHFKYVIAAEYVKNKEFFQLYLYWKAHKVVCLKHWLKPNYKTDYNQVQRTHQTIFCILNTQLEKARLDSKVDYEELQILYINYLAQFCNKPLLAYVELKKYQTKGQLQSFYFQSVKQQMTRYLQTLINQFQIENRLIYLQTKVVQEKQLSISSIYKTLQFQMDFLPAVIDVLNDKINFWQKLTKGFNSIYDLELLAIQQSQKVHNLAKQFYDYCQIDFSNLSHIQQIDNVQDLKLFSIFSSSIMNDYHNSLICETAITEVFNIEHTLQEDFISNLTFIQEKAALIMVSLVQNRGRIVNADKKLIAQLFNYSEQSLSSIDNISEFMPSFFAQKHDWLLLKYLQTAKSQFFDDYNQVFGKTQKGLLVSYQLKFDNNFNELDDYILIGCLSQFKKSSNFILFDENGFLIGVTENFFETIIQQDQQQTHFLPEYLKQIHIYFLMPSILELLNYFKNNFGKDTLNFQQEKNHLIFKYTDIKEMIGLSSKFALPTKQSSQTLQNYDKTFRKTEYSQVSDETDKVNKIIYNQLGQSKKRKEKNNSFLLKFQLFDSQFSNHIIAASQQLENSNKISYVAKVTLNCKMIGRKSHRQGYFILEIIDMKKSDDLFKTADSLANNQQTNSTQSNFKFVTNENDFDFQFSNFQIQKEEITPNISKKYGGYQNILTKLENRQNKNVDLLGQESGRDSLSYGPLSQRINFISPTSKQQHLQELLEQDFNELQVQLEMGIDDNRLEYDVSNSVKMRSNSQEQNSKRNSFIQILQNNKQDIMNQDVERSVKKSKSSITSGTSGISAITTIKQFQQKKEMIKGLKAICVINFIVILILCGFIISHIITITQYNNQIQQTLANLNGPTLFNRFFFKIFTYTWSLVFNTLSIIESSNFIIQQTMSEMKELSQIFFTELQGLYNNFINIEQAGMLSYITMDLLYNPSENVTYTYFINMITSVTNTLFQTINYDVKTLKFLINRDYCDNLLTLRYNLKNVVEMNFQLIHSLNDVFFSQQQLIIEQFQTSVIIEIVIVFVIIHIQLYYWKKVENYCQQILILVGRIQLLQAQEMIVRYSAIIETLKKTSGQQCWKKQNYYQLLFSPLNQLGLEIENIHTLQQSKILNQHSVSQSSKINKLFINKLDSNRQNLNVVLNSKILNTSTSIMHATLIVLATFFLILFFLLGGFLIYQNQQNALLPTQELTLSFIKFTSSMDIVISTALITKSQPLFYDKLVNLKIYSVAEINSFRDQRKIIKIFISLYSIYYENLTLIYENILKSNRVSNTEKGILLNLYQSNFCDLLSDSIPFCNFENVTNFNAQYGIPYPQDDNRIYLGKGIQGIVSRLDSFFKQSFYFEVNNTEYFPDQSFTKELLISQEFTNCIMEHFLDTTDGTNLFIDKLLEAVNSITNDDLYLLYAYYLITGIVLLILYFSFYGCWIKKSNQRLIFLRLILANLPIEVLIEPHTISTLRKLQ